MILWTACRERVTFQSLPYYNYKRGKGFFIERVQGVFWGFEAGPQILTNFRRRDGNTFVRRDERLDTDTAAYHPP
jgi:hypothetical protein